MFYVFCDVDGTLVDGFDNLRPGAEDFLRYVNELGGTLVVWSGGGAKYAQQKLVRVALDHLVKGYKGKMDLHPDSFPRYTFFVDDEEYLVDYHRRAGCGGYRVSFYNRSETPDTAFVSASEALKRWLDAGGAREGATVV